MENAEQAESGMPEVSGVQSVWGVLVAPENSFRALALRPHWLPALLLLVSGALALSVIVTPRLDMKQVMRDAIEDSGQEVSSAQLDKQAEMAEKFKWMGTVSQVVLQPAVYMIMAALFLVVFRLMGSDIDFRRSLSVAVHGMMPFLVATLLSIPVVLSRAELSLADVQSGSFLYSNLAAFAPESAGKPLVALLSSIDLFSIWSISLLAIGYRVVGKLSKMAALSVVLALWAVVVAGKIALGAI